MKRFFRVVLALSILLLVGITASISLLGSVNSNAHLGVRPLLAPTVNLSHSMREIQLILAIVSAVMVAGTLLYYVIVLPLYLMVQRDRISSKRYSGS